MEDADVNLKNPNIEISTTYYGNGCTPGAGSTKPCQTRLVTTQDDEIQKNGTYYNFQAATAGSGASLTADNAQASDTFCPLGWQLPYGGTDGDYYNQSKSWIGFLNSYELTNNTSSSQTLRSYPISYVMSGGLDMWSGKLYNQGQSGMYHSPSNADSNHDYRYIFGTAWIIITRDDLVITKHYGYPVRCN